MEEFRSAAADAAQTLDLDVVRAEELAAADETPQISCLREVRGSDLVVLILGQRYGGRQDSGLSATHEEYREARESKPVLVFVQDVDERDPAQADFIDETQRWTAGTFTAPFGTPDDLHREVIRAINRFLVSTAVGDIDPEEVHTRSVRETERSVLTSSTPTIAVYTAGGPVAQINSPSQLEDPEFAAEIQQEAFFGEDRTLDRSLATSVNIEGDRLVLGQETHAITIDQAGVISVEGPATERLESRFGQDPLNSTIVSHRIVGALRFTARLLDRLDSTHRLTHVCPMARLRNAEYTTWQDRSPTPAGASVMGIGSATNVAVALTPPTRARRSLIQNSESIASDLTALLRRQA